MGIRRILVADDEKLMRAFLKQALEEKNFEVTLAEDGREALALFLKEPFDLVITDMKMPQKSGLELLQELKKHEPNLLAIIMTAHGTIENAVEAMKAGAFNYLLKPFSLEALETLIDKACEQNRLIKENLFFRSEGSQTAALLKYSPYLTRRLEELKKIAQSEANVLICGESGTGKEIVASALHFLSQRAGRPFIKVNCAAIPETLIEAEFFGHEKGAFTGAEQKRIGRFELADTGTLLLDEISEIPLALQAKLLRVLQEQEIERIGSSKPVKINTRILATSNRNMEEAVKKRLFREDLFFRLNVVPFNIPPLRQRKEDLLPLSGYFLQSFCQKYKKTSKRFSKAAEAKLLAYPWPGNVRELSNIIERLVVLDQNPVVAEKDLPLESPLETGRGSLAEMEKKLILRTLQEQNKSRKKTAEILGISERALRYKLKAYGTQS
ncbi:MAG: sigma-54 dependent transcriptional regulator [Parachlamydiales bacterium]|jgi:two-component system response regulator AtoC